ncbi:hypothetical protein [Caldimonas tepidiphila]|uniref:hypothetical protein n=1 Tax=Caldimonas tepidiphila TaxID=2315841 RepID=UPI000E5B569C|nr:hypothetical protein [Caldimonas tepidiphila]
MMELRHAPIPSLSGWWNPLRHLRALYGADASTEDLPDTQPALWRPVHARPHDPRWGAADCPELLLGLCESPCALAEVFEQNDCGT